MASEIKIGIIGGSGFYSLVDAKNIVEHRINTPYGNMSDAVIEGNIAETKVFFLARHGQGHSYLPSEIPFLANIWGLKSLGITHLISVSVVGSLVEGIKPGHIVFPDQFIDCTRRRETTFFGKGIIGHVSMGTPICLELHDLLVEKAQGLAIKHHRTGSYVCIEGPRFSTHAESKLFASWGGSVVGMTNMPEASLAREAEMCYATLALATDYDSWRGADHAVNVGDIITIMRQNIEKSVQIISEAVVDVATATTDTCGCRNVLDSSIYTPREAIKSQVFQRLEPILARYMDK